MLVTGAALSVPRFSTSQAVDNALDSDAMTAAVDDEDTSRQGDSEVHVRAWLTAAEP